MELGLRRKMRKPVITILLRHETILQDVLANVAGAVGWAEDYIKDTVKALIT